ncbi:class I SAM-dependent methyltransferase [Deinococcus arcticus]|uniref:class I SAM-dependent methyltransferase n=1 Tax=Deinococcus arcticus TaxID=2136176 RepID=UPI001E5A1785|nr:class I SAM-dependent methyltransferase [Deinococcus arcticus]
MTRLAARDALLSRLCGRAWPEGALLDVIRPGPFHVLDVGAGDGRLRREAWARGHAGLFVGVDPHPGPGILAGRAEALPFHDATFDLALFVRVLAHLPRPEQALAEARRVLRRGAWITVAEHGPAHLRATWAALGRPATPPRPAPEPTFTITVPVTVTAEDARFLRRTYREPAEVPSHFFPVLDEVQLLVWWR